MRTRPRFLATANVLTSLCAALVVSGCTLVGLGIGAVEDGKRAKLRPVPAWRLATIRPGTNVVLHLDDGRRLEGPLKGTHFRDAAEYAPAYDTARQGRPGGLDLPGLGPCVLKDVSSGGELGVEWLGIDFQGIVVGAAGGSRTKVPFERVGALRDAQGRVVSGPALQRLAEARAVPLLSAITLAGVELPVPAERIVQIEAPSDKKRNAKLVGALIGLAVDTIVVVAAATGDYWDDGCSTVTSQGCASCPFVLSFDGRQYVRDAEVLGAATLESAQQTDRAQLGRVAEVNGEYRLRVANELREIDAIDALRLVVADAPPGTRVVATPEGRLLALVDPRPPREVRDSRGSDVTRLLRETDGQVWLSSPLGRDPRRLADLRDGLEIEFERPLDADSATLAFRLRSTTWAVQLLTEALALHGTDLPAWRARMNTDARARASFLRALRREVLPNVSVWDGQAWRPAGVLTNLGPWMDRDQALRVVLDGIAGPKLRVRLESAPGLWIVDSVSADFETLPAAEVVLLAARRADFNGENVLGALADADGRRVTLHQGDWIEMAFDAPPVRPDRARSVFVEATGYYTPLVRPDRDARPDVFARLVDEPGAVARWSLARVAAELALARHEAVDR